jgi:hypothetical protein
VSRISNFIVLSFSIVQNETHLASLDQNVFCIINCKENYEQLNAACKPVFDEINERIAEKGLFVDGTYYPVEFLFGGDMKFLQIILGLGSSLSTHACSWCRIHKGDRADMSKPFDHSKTVKLWEDFLSLYRFITHDEETKTIEFVFSKCKEWVNSFLDLGSMCQGYQNITLYLHCLVYHIPYVVVTYGKLVNYSGQGVEKIDDDTKKKSSIKNKQI